MNQKTYSTTFGDKTLTIETGKFAPAANGSCTVRMGDTVVLVTAVMSKDVRPGMGFFPLMVDFEEKLYASGRIKGSRFIKREGRPSDEAVLVARFIDRSIRPLFDERMKNEVQIIVTALSFDGENDPDILGLIGASAALHMSDIPWNGPIGAVRVTNLEGNLILNASYEDREKGYFDLDVAGTPSHVTNIEAKAHEASEDDLLAAFEKGMDALSPVIELIEEIRKDIGIEKVDVFAPKNTEEEALLAKKAEVEELAKAFMRPRIQDLFFAFPKASKAERNEAKGQLKHELVDYLLEQGVEEGHLSFGTDLIYGFVQDEISRMILEEGKRVDGREIEEIRDLTSEVQLLPRVHGSGFFTRGETHVLSVCTLGAPGDHQVLDNMETVGEKRYMHHYNFPPYSVGEAKPLRGTGRREIGHGALAEKALEFMIPDKEEFPYTIRVVSETLGSNGSSSMASTCGSTLALMDAGVPIKAPVAGIAIGLASRGDDWKVITDIQDLEDGDGGMDFKVTGTRDGVTAIQMDTKTKGLTFDIIKEALRQGKNGRLQILDLIESVIPAPRPELSPYAPRITKLRINPEKIREVIGPGGKMINEIIDTTKVEAIDIEQDGLVIITAKDQAASDAAKTWIERLTKEVEAGEIYEGKVTRLMDFGAFVEILPGKEGLVHISELAPWRVAQVKDIVDMDKVVFVRVKEIDEKGRINLTMKDVSGNVYTEEMKAKAMQRQDRQDRPKKSFDKKPHREKPASV